MEWPSCSNIGLLLESILKVGKWNLNKLRSNDQIVQSSNCKIPFETKMIHVWRMKSEIKRWNDDLFSKLEDWNWNKIGSRSQIKNDSEQMILQAILIRIMLTCFIFIFIFRGQVVLIRIINFDWIQEYENANQTVNDRIMRLFKLDD
jgi:hypothetical protein